MKYIKKFSILWVKFLGVKCLGVIVLGIGSLAILAAPAVYSQQIHIAHCQASCPTGASLRNQIVVRHLFAASVNYQSGMADWIAYRVLPDSVGVASLLPRMWRDDELLESGLSREDIAGSITRIQQPDLSNQQDRDYRTTEINIDPGEVGRLVPMTSFAGTPYWDELNYLSNMAALPSDLRLGSWSRLDQAVNELVASLGEAHVVAGPIYGIDSELQIADGLTQRAAAFYKVISTGQARAAFIFDADLPIHADYCTQVSNLQEVEAATGLTLFPGQTVFANDLAAQLGCMDSSRSVAC